MADLDRSGPDGGGVGGGQNDFVVLSQEEESLYYTENRDYVWKAWKNIMIGVRKLATFFQDYTPIRSSDLPIIRTHNQDGNTC